MYRWTVLLQTRMPSLRSSPRRRSAPQRGLLVAISRISAARGRGSTRRPRASAPERATACLVPAEDGRRLDEQRGVAPRRRHACCEPHREALPRCPPDPPRDLSLRDDELLPKQGVLGDETRRGGARRRRPAPPRTEGPRTCGALYRGQRADAICSQDG